MFCRKAKLGEQIARDLRKVQNLTQHCVLLPEFAIANIAIIALLCLTFLLTKSAYYATMETQDTSITL